MAKLTSIDRHVYDQRTKSLSVIGAMFVVGLLVATFLTVISIELSLHTIDLVVFKFALGDNGNDQGKQMEILPCDREHECQSSI